VSNQEKVTMLLETQLNILDYEVHENGLIRIYDKFNDAFLINKTLMTHKIEISRLALSEDKLEDYFINLTGGAIK
jgi:bacitracin transport system ATP-binding protein